MRAIKREAEAVAAKKAQGTGNSQSIARLIARELRSGNKRKSEPTYPQWRDALEEECRRWLSSNGLNTRPARYLANFIEASMERWSYTRTQAVITSDGRKGRRAGQRILRREYPHNVGKESP